MPKAVHYFVTIGFLAIIACAAALQTAVELRRGRGVEAMDVFRREPTVENLRSYERRLEETSVVAGAVRPWAQYARFRLLDDAGEKVVVGRGGWLFYREAVDYLTQRPESGERAPVDARNALAAIVSFRDQLAARGVHLLVVPVPNKESVYPERLSRRAEGAGVIVGPETSELLAGLRASGVEVVDLFDEFRRAKQEPAESQGPLYLVQDSHWTPEGMQRSARAVAQRAAAMGWAERGGVEYRLRPAPVERHGDLLEMLQSPPLLRCVAPEDIACQQVISPGGALYRDAPDSPILVLGDSFLRIYQRDPPQSAGFVAHLAYQLKRPVTSLVSDGGASTLVRQDLARRPALLANKKLVIWEFVERDIRYGAEGWQEVPLPAGR